jgi:hypothetical protein
LKEVAKKAASCKIQATRKDHVITATPVNNSAARFAANIL